jgi:hypothetical protein
MSLSLDCVVEILEKERSNKNFARRAVSMAVKNGKLKKEPCLCGNEKVEAHHEDYTHPLDVIWVCKKHHILLDKMRRERNIDFVYEKIST